MVNKKDCERYTVNITLFFEIKDNFKLTLFAKNILQKQGENLYLGTLLSNPTDSLCNNLSEKILQKFVFTINSKNVAGSVLPVCKASFKGIFCIPVNKQHHDT